MRHLRLFLPALALVVTGTWANQATACDKDKATTAAASHAACTAEMAAKCTPEMAAACKAKGAAKTASMDCCASKSTATTAAKRRSGTKSAAVTASMMGGTGTSAAMAADHCAGTKSAAVAAAHGSCAAKGTASASAITAGFNPEHCAGMMGAATVAAGSGSCSAKGKVTAVAAGSGGQCSGHSTSAATRMAHADCDACEDMILCSGELETAGTRTQVVPLKNGVMFVYTTEDPGKVSAVQSAMARRSDRLNQIVTAGDRARLCPECKTLRGAIASGKMTREVINIEGGALTLMTSNDPVMVKKIRAIADANKVARAKS